MATLPGQIGSRAGGYFAPYLSRFVGNRFVGNSVREAATDLAQGIAEPFMTHGMNQGVDHVNQTTGSNIPHVTTAPPNTAPNFIGSVFGNYLLANRTYVYARATQTFHGPNTNEGVNNFVRDTNDAVHFDRFWENNGS